MPWSNLSPMDHKTQFIADFLRHSQSITELCSHYCISRKTAYKWINRFQQNSFSGLKDRSRRPKYCPHQTEPDLVEALLDARRHHPTWARKNSSSCCPSDILTALGLLALPSAIFSLVTRDGLYCYPLTITDGFSRYLLGCQALLTTACADAKVVFQNVFREFGLPDLVRTDNGVPFVTVSLARLSSLSTWWIQLGILPELIEPGKHNKMAATNGCTAH